MRRCFYKTCDAIEEASAGAASHRNSNCSSSFVANRHPLNVYAIFSLGVAPSATNSLADEIVYSCERVVNRIVLATTPWPLGNCVPC
jgi:hypothetical protein